MLALRYCEHTAELRLGPERFTYTWHTVLEEGWVAVMPWRLADLRLNTEGAVSTRAGAAAPISSCAGTEGVTEPPPYLKEHELIGLMDRHGIGTDASIPTHVQNIGKRRYITVCDSDGNPVIEDVEAGKGKGEGKGNGKGKDEGKGKGKGKDCDGGKGAGKEKRTRGEGGGKGTERAEPAGDAPPRPSGRHMVPTALGVALIEALQRCDASLVLPDLRAKMEQQMVAAGGGVILMLPLFVWYGESLMELLR
jgi:hypothetical protein